MKNILIICTSLFFSASSYGQVFKVEALIDGKSIEILEREPEKAKGQFLVQTKITNISKKDQKFVSYTCSYGFSWIVDKPGVRARMESCRSNISGEIILKSGQVYDRPLALSLTKAAKEGVLDFKLGFSLIPEADPDQIKKETAIWSNSLKMSVTKSILKSVRDWAEPKNMRISEAKSVELMSMPYATRKLMFDSGCANCLSPEEVKAIKKQSK